MKDIQIPKIENLIQLKTGQISDYKVKRLTAPGENYGSLMLSVDVKTSTGEEINLIAKLLPGSQFMRELFNLKVAFKNEIALYTHVVPALKKFQEEHKIGKLVDFAPKFYGGRLNLDNGDELGEEAALVLENLKVQNYVVFDRIEGFDLEAVQIILEALAELHAVPLALKLQKPEVFDAEIKPYLQPWKPIPNHLAKMKKDLHRLLKKIPELEPLEKQIMDEFQQQIENKPPREPFATYVHNDLWTTNAMLKIDDNKVVKCKLLDYALCSYSSPARDVLFLLFSSLKPELLEANFDNLLKFYHERFIGILQDLQCDVKPFSYEAFLQEIDFEARNSQFAHIAFMLFVVCAVKENVKDVSEMTSSNLISENDSEILKERFLFFVKEFIKRKWIFN